MAGARQAREERARRRARRVGAVGFALAFALPIVLWHSVIGQIAGEFTFDAKYFVTGWSPWVLMALGLACFIPVAVADLRDKERRFYQPGMGAWVGWGVTLYLLGFALATQVSQIAGSLSS